MERADITQIARGLGISKRGAELRATREGWPFETVTVRGGQRRLYILKDLPVDVGAAVVRMFMPRPAIAQLDDMPARRRVRRRYDFAQINAAWDRFGRCVDRVKKVGIERARALETAQQLQDAGMSRVQAFEEAARVHQVSLPTLYRWRDRVGAIERMYWPAFLLPQYTGRPGKCEIPERAWDLFKADYLSLEAPEARACYDRLQIIAEKHGWELPSLSTFKRRIAAEIPRPVQVLAREGEEALAKLYPPMIRDRTGFHALEAVNADGHRFDVFCRWPDGTIGRPLMVAWQDLGSSKLLAYRVGQAESSVLVQLSYADMCTTYDTAPRNAWLDNGRGFAAKWLTGGTPTRYRFKVKPDDAAGIFVLCGTKVHWTTPYHGQAKPIERAFRDLCERVAKHPAFAGAWTGNNPMAKPENYGSHAVPIEQFEAVLATEIARHNSREDRRSSVAQGRSFDAVFNESWASVRDQMSRLTDEQRRVMWLASEPVTAHRSDGSVALPGHRFWHESLSAFAGQKVVLRFDPAKLESGVYAYTLAGDFIAHAAMQTRVAFADSSAAAPHAQARNAFKGRHKARLAVERPTDRAEVAEQLLGDLLPAPSPIAERVVVKRAPSTGELTDAERSFNAFLEQEMDRRIADSL